MTSTGSTSNVRSKGCSGRTVLRWALPLTTAVLVVAGCSHSGESGDPHSRIITLTLPAGSTLQHDRGDQPGFREQWNIPEPYADALAALRRQLPLEREFDGVPWCSESHADGSRTELRWAQTGGDAIWLSLSGNGPVDPKNTGLTITHGKSVDTQCVPAQPHSG